MSSMLVIPPQLIMRSRMSRKTGWLTVTDLRFAIIDPSPDIPIFLVNTIHPVHPPVGRTIHSGEFSCDSRWDIVRLGTGCGLPLLASLGVFRSVARTLTACIPRMRSSAQPSDRRHQPTLGGRAIAVERQRG